jgi:hypothetical protein
MISRRTLVAVAIVAVAATILASCAEPYTGAANSPKVAVVGDSLVAGAHDSYRWLLTTEGWNSSVAGLSGFTVADSQGVVTQMAATHPSAMVIALGTNDIRQMANGTEDMTQFHTAMTTMLASVADIACVVWVGVAESNGTSPPLTLVAARPALNAAIKAELTKTGRPNRYYADWAAASTGHPELFNGSGQDHIDKTPSGNLIYASLGVTALQQCPGAPKYPARSAPASTPPNSPTS